MPNPRTGFHVDITLPTESGEDALQNTTIVREAICRALDELGIEQEIDYILEVKRVHYQQGD